MRRLLPQSAYARNVLTLMTGTTLAQAIPIAISPILTRLDSPEEFGRFALYMAVAMIASVLVTGRYELAILLPRHDRDALHITALAMALSVAISAVLLLIVIFLAQPIAALLGDVALAPWLYWVPASTLLLGVYQSLNYWSNRKAQYKRLAISRTVQSGSAALAQLGSGYAGSGAVGLVGGQITGQVLATSVLARLIWREDHQQIRALRPARSLVLAKKYINFPKYLTVANAFCRAGLIESWGRGIGRIKDACAQDGYPTPIWALEPGAWWMTFTYVPENVAPRVADQVIDQVTKEIRNLLQVMQGEIARADIQILLGLRHTPHVREVYLQPALVAGLIEMTLPEKSNSRLQKYRLTEAGQQLQAALLPTGAATNKTRKSNFNKMNQSQSLPIAFRTDTQGVRVVAVLAEVIARRPQSVQRYTRLLPLTPARGTQAC